ncbi:MAG TPA: flagellar basal body L-ring protein FlgH [Phenylobacterium sp.]|uniref:flagellar basal body L-ring protein FlgH n=1 Tax=Phenylobacterium sp. TaxID=1871053 RepID=UPI002B483EA0|nr:flagellar basal body L-ring protein FlgH [Phenylobacterium sp.]HKR88426.1 flagellar basal body L-ring protein FlgH [Phenylobacterium sp.]
MSPPLRSILLAAAVLAPLGACSSVSEAVNGPKLAPVGYPAALVPQEQTILSPREPIPGPASANSLWRNGARAFFADQRAARVGDILTVLIDIDDKAKTSNTTVAGRDSAITAGIPHVFGLESSLGRILPGAYDPANTISTNTKTTNTGAGSVDRKEQISLTIAAVVTAVLPNGNLVIQGSQEVQTNAELRQLTVAGIVRPEDISSSNTIRHTQIAEARINYGGRGDISRVQKTPAGQSLVEKFSPF